MTDLIPLPWDRPPLTGNRVRGNPQTQGRKRRDALEAARWAIRAAQLEWRPGANVTLHFRPATKHRRDSDGMYPTLKAATDALVLEGVLSDDSWVEVPRASCEIHPPTDEPAAMWLTLEEIPRVP